jgi:hypothetical protein
MNTELATQTQQPDPFARMVATGGGINAGAVEIESQRAIAEAQGQLILAKRFPRSMAAATAELMEACKSPEFAASAFYSVPNRGSGPSIRFAEEVARVYGNFQYGHRELSRHDGRSEIEVYAWDMEKNNRSPRQITVLHVLDTKNGPKKLTDQADIDNKIANVASKQMRGRIMALVPKHLVALGIAECKKTLAGNNDEPISARVTKMTASFSRFGVNAEHLARYIGHSLDDVTIDELADLVGVYNAIREGAKASEYFGAPEQKESAATAVAAIAAQAKIAPAAPAVAPPAAAPAAKQTTPKVAVTQRRNPTQPEGNVTKSQQPESDQNEAPPQQDDGGQPDAGDDNDVF